MELPAKGTFPIPEVADLLDVPKRTLYKMIDTGEIPAEHVRKLGQWRMTRAYLCELLGIVDPYAIRFAAPAQRQAAS